jgi:hypothetical protein
MMAYKYLTFDLETLGNTAQAPIVQIAALGFDGKVIEPSKVFNVRVELKSLQHFPFEVDYETVGWWLSQDKGAIDDVFNAQAHKRLHIIGALKEFRHFWKENCDASTQVYSHATFDPPILDHAYRVVDKTRSPIPFRSHKDIRTLTSLYLELVGKPLPEITREGNHHDAASDCIYQARYITEMLMELENLKVSV